MIGPIGNATPSRRQLRAILGTTAALTVAAAIAATAHDSARGADPAQPAEFTLTLKNHAQRIIDNPPRRDQPTIGDFAAFNKVLLDSNGKRVGTVHAHGMITAGGNNPTETIEGMMILAGGRLAVQEAFRFNDRIHTIAITGGTGKYDGASGTITSGLPGQGENDLLFRIRLP